jgi:manganese/zinc/iron transport system permease protein
MNWTSLDTWIVIIAVLSAVACSLPGCFLVLRKMSMMGDAISHAILPGLAIAFLWTHSRDSLAMFVGAALVGVLTAVFVDWVVRFGGVDEGASMGVVFTTLFAIGLILIVQAADQVDLDPGCVLYGALELVPLDTINLGSFTIPRAALKLTAALLVNIGFVTLFFKELMISTFDPSLSDTQGISSKWMNLFLMGIVAVTAVAAFESVGSILVIAMLIVPAACAQLLTDRMGPLLVISSGVAMLSAILGHVSAITVPKLFGFEDTNTAGMMAVVAGCLFTLCVLFAPRKGLLSQMSYRLDLSLKMVEEDILGWLYRLDEGGSEAEKLRDNQSMQEGLLITAWTRRIATARLRRKDLLRSQNGQYVLSNSGQERARQLVRSHRIWEVYLNTHLNTPHIHSTAHRLEHALSPAELANLEAELDFPETDPHGTPIPAKASESDKEKS